MNGIVPEFQHVKNPSLPTTADPHPTTRCSQQFPRRLCFIIFFYFGPRAAVCNAIPVPVTNSMIGQMAVIRRGYAAGAAGQGPFLEGPPALRSSVRHRRRRRRRAIRHKRWTTKGFHFKSYYLYLC